mgnify:CR=1 FL=1|tara:strand:- start:43 stop:225 length:183 start_codon:yes stop_codon:yes gene_type:complete
MEKEHKDELKQLNVSTDHYKQQLKKPAWKYIFDHESSHDIAKRMIDNNEKRIKEIESYYK